jgi:hypothetical protein
MNNNGILIKQVYQNTMGFSKHYLGDFETSISVNDTNITKTIIMSCRYHNWFSNGIAWFLYFNWIINIFQIGYYV